MRKMTVGLVSHLVRDYNLGCSALAVSNIRLMDSVFAEYDVQPCYRVILSEPRYPVDLASYTSLVGVTSNPYEYRTYPRLKATIKTPRSSGRAMPLTAATSSSTFAEGMAIQTTTASRGLSPSLWP